MVEFTMPSLGADMEDGILREWRVKPGDKVKRGDIIAEVETQKGLIEIEVFEEGTVGKLLLEVGKKIPVGTVMTHILGDGETEDQVAVTTVSEKIPKKTDVKKDRVRIKASPLAKTIALEKGIDLSSLKGSGEDGTIIKADVEKAISDRMAPLASDSEREPSSPAGSIRSAIAAAMSRSNRDIPHFYLETRIDMSKALEFLNTINKTLPVSSRILPAVLLIKAVAGALKEVPDLNAWWVNGLQKKNEVHVGFVVSLRTGGIIVPTIRDAGKKTLQGLMASLNDLIPRARNLKLRSSELSESTITITNLGDQGAESVFGVIYPPQVALVGFGLLSPQVWVQGDALSIRPVIHATLAADHRAGDGISGSRFLNAIKRYLEQPELL